MTTEDAFAIILKESDHLHRMPQHDRATLLGRRDYIRGRLLPMVVEDAVYRAE